MVRTSNPGGRYIQDCTVNEDGKKIWERVLDQVVKQWDFNKNFMPVLGVNETTSEFQYDTVRSIIPDEMPILVPGIGAQGGNPAIIKSLLNSNRRGVIVSSSRNILYPTTINNNTSFEQWKEEVTKQVVELKDTLNKIRYK